MDSVMKGLMDQCPHPRIFGLEPPWGHFQLPIFRYLYEKVFDEFEGRISADSSY